MKILEKKNFWIAHQKNLVPRMLSHRGNVRTSKFWRKSKEKKRNFFRKFTKGIWGFDLGKKKFKIISCLCTFNWQRGFGFFTPGKEKNGSSMFQQSERQQRSNFKEKLESEVTGSMAECFSTIRKHGWVLLNHQQGQFIGSLLTFLHLVAQVHCRLEIVGVRKCWRKVQYC